MSLRTSLFLAFALLPAQSLCQTGVDIPAGTPLALTIEFTHDGKSKRIAVADLPEPDAQGRIQYVANSPIAQFDPGNYAVHFIVTQGTERAEENFAILLEP